LKIKATNKKTYFKTFVIKYYPAKHAIRNKDIIPLISFHNIWTLL